MMCNCADISVLYYHTYIREIYMYSYPTGESLDGLITHSTCTYSTVRVVVVGRTAGLIRVQYRITGTIPVLRGYRGRRD